MTAVSLPQMRKLLQRLKIIQAEVHKLETQVSKMKGCNLKEISDANILKMKARVKAFQNKFDHQQSVEGVSLEKENDQLRRENSRLDYRIQQTNNLLRQYSTQAASVNIEKESWGTSPCGQNVDLYTLRNKTGMTVKISSFGGIVVSLEVPDKCGNYSDVVAGFDNLQSYVDGHPFFGPITGRYANRIAKGSFQLNGKTYSLATNNGENHLHGGKIGFDKRVWKVEKATRNQMVGLALTYVSPDGEEGYPGTMTIRVCYLLLPSQNCLTITYEATTDADTVVNLTNHSYFNLSGKFTQETMLGHEMRLNCDHYLPVDNGSIPFGKLESVEGTPFDFRASKPIGRDINDSHKQVNLGPGGYDHNMCINQESEVMNVCANVYDPISGRSLEVRTDQPGVQLYTGNFLKGQQGKGNTYGKQTAFCLETQHFPDSPNQHNFPTTVLRSGETFRSQTSFQFDCQ